MLTLIRLRSVKTDFVITINIPHVKGEYNESEVNFETAELGSQVRDALLVRDEILRSLDIRDWSLFGVAEP